MKTQRVTLWHEPFARFEFQRETIQPAHGVTCSWCGNTSRHGKLFRYYTKSDELYARPEPYKGLFCSVGCLRSYHD